jgi:hypothetical protein
VEKARRTILLVFGMEKGQHQQAPHHHDEEDPSPAIEASTKRKNNPRVAT